jgi:AP-4 complex subunit beta-1
MIRDPDVQVVTNCLMALDEILIKSGGIKTTKKMIFYLIGRAKEFNEWHLCLVLSVLLKYTPKNNKEIVEIMVFFSN